MKIIKAIISRLSNLAVHFREWLRRGSESEKATRFWGELDDYHLSNDNDPTAINRSKWVAQTILPVLGSTSLLEVGCNSGRNLHYIRVAYPSMSLKGIDVNPRAIEYARATKPEILFELSDVNNWTEDNDSWDCALTMSVIDHIPEDAARILATNIARSCRAVIGVELWDGSSGERALYKYSSDLKSMYEDAGFQTVMWEPAPENLQYDKRQSTLWVYVGRRLS